MIEALLFYVISAILLIGALLTVSLRNIFRAALALILSLIAVAALYLLLQAPYVAAVQLLIYVGAIAVLILFAIMLTEHFTQEKIRSTNQQVFSNLLLCLILGTTFIAILATTAFYKGEPVTAGLDTLGNVLFVQYMLPFEVLSILLLIALVGAIIIARNGEKD